jgi:hypothetical protein
VRDYLKVESLATFMSTLTYSKMKNKAAVALGRLGGKASAKNLTGKERQERARNAALTGTSEERSARARKAAFARWPRKIHTLKKPCAHFRDAALQMGTSTSNL